jgi:hypothetical protein
MPRCHAAPRRRTESAISSVTRVSFWVFRAEIARPRCSVFLDYFYGKSEAGDCLSKRRKLRDFAR